MKKGAGRLLWLGQKIAERVLPGWSVAARSQPSARYRGDVAGMSTSFERRDHIGSGQAIAYDENAMRSIDCVYRIRNREIRNQLWVVLERHERSGQRRRRVAHRQYNDIGKQRISVGPIIS